MVSNLNLITVIFLALMTCLSRAAITGKVTADNTLIQATDITYLFSLSFSKQVPTDGKLVIRFPIEYQGLQFTPVCTVSQLKVPIQCDYVQNARLLQFTDTGFLERQTQVSIEVSQVTNPSVAMTTQPFQITTYAKDGEDYILRETGGNTIKITTSAGSISQNVLTLGDPTVGLFSLLELSLTAEHAIPSKGQIQLQLPKWNQFDPTVANYESMIAVAASVTEIECLNSQGIKSAIFACVFTQGRSSDILTIQLNEDQDIPPNREVHVIVQGVRGPPSQSQVTGFTLYTADSSGVMIDEVKSSESIVLEASIAVKTQTSSVGVSTQPTTVSAISEMTLSVQNFNPLRVGSTIRITIPPEFNIDAGPIDVTTLGQTLDPNPIFNIQQTNRQLTISKFNVQYLEQYQVSYFYISGIGNPSNIRTTRSFQVELLDQNLQTIEYVDNGVTFEATTGGFISVALAADNSYINAAGVAYTFTLEPENSFNSQGVLKLTFPDELWLDPNSYIQGTSANIALANAKVSTTFNHVLTIRNAFTRGYVQGDLVVFTVVGVTNPRTTQPTHPVQIDIYYESKSQGSVDELIDVYEGLGLVFQADPSPHISIDVALSAKETGKTNEVFEVSGTTPSGMIIEQGSHLRIYIPPQFLISDPSRVASSCTATQGFSDEVTCRFESVDTTLGAYLLVTQGFNSQQFQGGQFSFYMSEVKNPFTTAETDAFGIEVIDRNGYKLYKPTTLSYTVKVQASNFAFSFVESSSPVNGVSSMYQVSLTLSVDTPFGSIVSVELPSELSFDSSQGFKCEGTMNLKQGLDCDFNDGRKILVILMPSNQWEAGVFVNGTTLNFQIGYIFNSISLKETGSFKIQTLLTSTNEEYISERLQGLTIVNSQRGSIQVNSIQQTGSNELSQTTEILINLTTQNKIPASSRLTIILPSNFVLKDTVTVLVNNVPYTATVDQDTYMVVVITQQANLQDFAILIANGLSNPRIGPYSYSGFAFELQSAQGYAIDAELTLEVFARVECDGLCSLCVETLNGCVTCGADLATQTVSYLSGTTCLEQCPPGWFGGSGYKCEQCVSPCLECNYAYDLCTKCDPFFGKPYANLVSLACYTSCPSGTYLNADTSQCIVCKSPCYTCSDELTCLTCDYQENNPAVYFFENKCYNVCPPVAVPSPSKICVDCEAPCKTCTDLPDKCLSCTGDLFVYRNLCVQDCPFNYYKDHDEMECRKIASMDIPFPFTVLALMCTVFMTISHYMKNGSSDNQGTSFFISMLAFVDMLLRVNWIVLGFLSLEKQYYWSCGWCAVILITCLILNLVVWRRFFKFKYNMDDNDYNFVTYCKKYPKTSRAIIFLSYGISFQAIRLTYSRILGKKRFMASFTRQRKYYRLIGQLSIMEIFLVFIPAIALNVYNLFYYKLYEQIFYIGVDSLLLVLYATVLIAITLSQREKVLDPGVLFNWKELLRFNVDTDDEAMYKDEVPEVEKELKGKGKRFTVMGGVDEELDQEEGSESDSGRVPFSAFDALKKDQENFMSERNLHELQRNKLYQTEVRQDVINEKVFIIDYNLYRDLQDKLDTIQLKKMLYVNQRDQDYKQFQKISKKHVGSLKERDSLKARIKHLKRSLGLVQLSIHTESSQRKKQTKVVEQPPLPLGQRRRNSVQPQLEDFLFMKEKKQNSKSQSRAGNNGGRAFYFDQYSRKVYYDEENKSAQGKLGSPRASDDTKPRSEVVVVNQRSMQRRGTLAYKQASIF